MDTKKESRGKDEEETYFTLSMTLLTSLRQSDVTTALRAAEEMSSMMGGVLPADSPASLLLSMKDELAAYQKFQEEAADSDEATSSEDDSDSPSSSSSPSDSSENDDSESIESSGSDTVDPSSTVEEELVTVLQHVRNHRNQLGVKKKDDEYNGTPFNTSDNVKQPVRPPLADSKKCSRSLLKKRNSMEESILPEKNKLSAGSNPPDEEIELCAEDLRALQEIENEVSREMERLAIIRGNR